MSNPSACTYVVPRKKTCRHPCKLVTRKNKVQCRTKYLKKKKKKPKGTKKKRKKKTQEETATPSPQETPSPQDETPTPSPQEETQEESTTATDPLKSMVNILSKRVSLFQKPAV